MTIDKQAQTNKIFKVGSPSASKNNSINPLSSTGGF